MYGNDDDDVDDDDDDDDDGNDDDDVDDDDLGSQDWLASLSDLSNHGKFHICRRIQVLIFI